MKMLKEKSIAVVLGFMVAAGASSVSAQEGISVDSREKMFTEATELLDKVETESPNCSAELVKIRERLVGLYNAAEDASTSDNGISFSAQRSTNGISRANKARRVAFYDSVRGEKNESLRSKLRSEISCNKAFNYSAARKKVILEIDNHHGNVECVYTGKIIKVNPPKMPSPNTLNIEHTWPQSKGATGVAKADMHHLFPTISKANSYRGNFPFGEFSSKGTWSEGGSKFNGKVFCVRPQHRGNAARAMFYFAVRYGEQINSAQEKVLRRWHKEDPVDANERARNDKVEAIQHNRNPFIDHPEFVDQITDF